PISPAGSRGTLAWAVFDESLKARMNLHEARTMENPAAAIARAGSPSRNGVFALEGLESFKPDAEMAPKLITYDTSITATELEDLRAYHPDLTPWSVSLLTNPVLGGFKGDLSTRFTMDEPIPQTVRLYQEAGLPTGESDPPLSLLRSEERRVGNER